MLMTVFVNVILLMSLSCSNGQWIKAHQRTKLLTRLSSTLATSMFLFNSPAWSFYESNALSDVGRIQATLMATKRNLDVNPDVNEAFNEVEFVLKTLNLKLILSEAVANAPYESQICAKSSAQKIVEDLYNIVEYFSVSNDTKKKLMISDSFPGQKLTFVRQGWILLNNLKEEFSMMFSFSCRFGSCECRFQILFKLHAEA